jgi:uncharacterized membrane protein YadS
MARPALIRPARRPLANGAVLAVALAALAELTSRALQGWLNPDGPSPVSPVLCAVLLGVAWRNTIGLSPGFVPGLQWITNTLLRLGIALLMGSLPQPLSHCLLSWAVSRLRCS